PCTSTDRFNAVNAAIDAVNAEDPRKIALDGVQRPFETVYAERITETLEQMYLDTHELLFIAVHARQIRRWRRWRCARRGRGPVGRVAQSNPPISI
ncbi:MAG: DUF4202 domain-containing protein, partial [Alphaproteobacteria bacterium]|nr:DUF4202 domain-containing protein [Alphaproteobacteria bacterium]